jgi:hypothetical protein
VFATTIIGGMRFLSIRQPAVAACGSGRKAILGPILLHSEENVSEAKQVEDFL